MATAFCEEITDSDCEPGPDVEIQLPGEGSTLAVLGVATVLVYSRSEDEPELVHSFDGPDVFVLASPPDDDGNQVLFLTGPGLQVTGRGIEG